MELPIPSHLKFLLIPFGDENSEFEVTGKIRCGCDCEQFEVFESNERHIVKLICSQCAREFLLFDAGIHGWDGFVCKDDFLDRSLPFQKYTCETCGEDRFTVGVYISSQGKEDFIKECVSNDDSFTADDWINGFEWITVSLNCDGCGASEDDWLDLETM